MKFKTMIFAGVLCVALLHGSSLFAQADALVDMLQKKGLLTAREASEVKEQMFKDTREALPGTKLKVGSWLDEMNLSGDVRVRYETFTGRQLPSANGTFDEVDRTRYRLRLRLGLTAKAGDWRAGLRLASGDVSGPTADPIATNTTFDQFSAKKNINLDLAYISYEPSAIAGLKLTGGKMENPFWESDMLYDFDLTPEGLAGQYTRAFNDRFSLFANFGQWVLAEDNTTTNNGAISRGKDAYMLGSQIGYTWKIVPSKVELKQAVAYYDYLGITDQAATLANTSTTAVIRNSLRTTGAGTVVWAKDYNIFTLNNELKLGYWKKVPIALYGEYVNNTATGEFDDGYKVGFKLWDAKKKGEYEVGYWYERLDADANMSVFSDSDFGSGGTNTKGHILKGRYNFTDWAFACLSYYYVENVDDFVESTGTGGISSVNNQMRVDHRIQFDINMKF